MSNIGAWICFDCGMTFDALSLYKRMDFYGDCPLCDIPMRYDSEYYFPSRNDDEKWIPAPSFPIEQSSKKPDLTPKDGETVQDD